MAKPKTLQEHLEQSIKRAFKAHAPLRMSEFKVEPQGDADTHLRLNFDVEIAGTCMLKKQSAEWQLYFTVLNDRISDIVYDAPRFSVLTSVDRSASSGMTKKDSLDKFADALNRSSDRVYAEARKLDALIAHVQNHSLRIQKALEMIAAAVKTK
jgi:hypothetical protein